MPQTQPAAEPDLPCLQRIERAYPGLGDTGRQIADYVLEHRVTTVGLSITELASLSQVSETSVLRFARRLGYRGYRQFALALAAAAPAGDHDLPVDIADTDAPATIMRKVFAAEAQALAGAWQSIEPHEWQRACDALAQGRRVHCYAVGGSGLLAMEAAYRLVRLGIDCYAICDPIQIAIQAARLGNPDVAIGFSQTGRTRDTVEGLRIARAAGAVTIAVTSQPHSPIVAASSIALVLLELHAAYRGAHLDSKVAELTLIDALSACLARRLPPGSPEAAERLAAGLERFFLPERTARQHRPG